MNPHLSHTRNQRILLPSVVILAGTAGGPRRYRFATALQKESARSGQSMTRISAHIVARDLVHATGLPCCPQSSTIRKK